MSLEYTRKSSKIHFSRTAYLNFDPIFAKNELEIVIYVLYFYQSHYELCLYTVELRALFTVGICDAVPNVCTVKSLILPL